MATAEADTCVTCLHTEHLLGPRGDSNHKTWLGRHHYAHFRDEVAEEMEEARMDFLKGYWYGPTQVKQQ